MDGHLQQDISRAEALLARLEEEREQAIERLEALRAKQAASDSLIGASSPAAPVPPRTAAAKIALFTELFRGRTDVYARRWVNKRKRTKGYAPACANEWVHGLCEKPRVKCGVCTNQSFLRVSADAIRSHLKGRHIMGVYHMLPDDTCWFLALDFDKGAWREDVEASSACRPSAGEPR